jgi:hypothetical protein
VLGQGEGGGQCNRPGPPQEHEQDQDVLGRQGELGGDAGRQPGRAEGRERLEQGARQWQANLGGEGEGGRDHRAQPDQGDGQGLALGPDGDAPPEGVDRRPPARLGGHHQQEHGKGRDPDAAAGPGAARPDEHEDVGDQPRRLPMAP